jgi:hypothetical protein
MHACRLDFAAIFEQISRRQPDRSRGAPSTGAPDEAGIGIVGPNDGRSGGPMGAAPNSICVPLSPRHERALEPFP